MTNTPTKKHGKPWLNAYTSESTEVVEGAVMYKV
ncbi:uncharacterized protein G2W53_021700 [Senna tora]|uniref:Uncharacterized protein n=1 Tax=Senna tora TaxID=362788 RepID=A0A834TMF4_9FABA|nr:uncharacterized protein G2W53_021700 [Senna tora]